MIQLDFRSRIKKHPTPPKNLPTPQPWLWARWTGHTMEWNVIFHLP